MDHPEQPISPAGADHPPILVVDDDEAVRLAMILMVDELGFTADAVSNGQEALEALARHHYALVLMDFQMPVCDGCTATRTIRETVDEDRQPVIIGLTGTAIESARARGLAAGMNECLFKPLPLPTLEEALRRWLRA